MQKTRLQMSMMQLAPMPNPYRLAKKIQDSIHFIDDNKNITLSDVLGKWIKLWAVQDLSLLNSINDLPLSDDKNIDPSLFTAVVVFTHIYTRYYREEDFADFGNFITMFTTFQKLLSIFLSASKSGLTDYLPDVKLFDLKNLDDSLYRMIIFIKKYAIKDSLITVNNP